MIYDQEELLRIVDFRVKTTPYHGTLCKVQNRQSIIHAMTYFNIWDYSGFITNPYCEMSDEMIQQMDWAVYRIFVEYVLLYMPPFTRDEIRSIIDASKKFGYSVIRNNGYINFLKVGSNAYT